MSDDVSQFLQQVEELKGRRIEEDEARSRELEERILQERSERAARRAERARSISPQKSSPAGTPSIGSRSSFILTDNLRLDSPSRHNTGESHDASLKMESSIYSASSPTKENDGALDSHSDSKITDSISIHSRSTSRDANMPSWQRRQLSQSPDKFDRRSRPLSVLATENALARTATSFTDPPPSRDQTLTKDQIAQALGSKDPAWFRQTSDRGANSPVYRRNQVEDEDQLDMSNLRKGFPGMIPESGSPQKRIGTRSGPSLDLSASPKLDPPSLTSPGPDGNDAFRSPSSRASPGRPISPTKGLGGFVQSAMMKRNDSVKRWSVTSPGGLARAESTAASRTGNRPTSIVRDTPSTPLHKSRPSSRQGSYEKDEIKEETTASIKPPADPIFDPKYVAKQYAATTVAAAAPEGDESFEKDTTTGDKITPPTSPSKGMESSRRWSPTKASWLETALNKPESPKKSHAPSLSQPAWMVELNKAKAQKTGIAPEVDTPKSPAVKHEVKIGGLMRNIPMGSTAAPAPIRGVYTPPTIASPFGPSPHKKTTSTVTSDEIKPPVVTRPAAMSISTSRPSAAAIAAKPKPDIPEKIDFRSTLKTRKSSPSISEASGSPADFRAVVGSLRRTTTKNYVAPDVLKDTIVQGKNALNATGGPKKSELRDEFKDDILRKRESFKKAQMMGKGVRTKTGSISQSEIPEGLQKFKQLGNRSPIVTGSTFVPPTNLMSPPVASKPSSLTMRQNMESVERATEKLSLQVQNESRASTESTTLVAKSVGRVGGLAGKLNPGLAGLLARGPPPMATSSSAPSHPDNGDSKPAVLSGTTETPAAPGPQLTHLTKGRSRGPRRRAPTSKPVAATITEEESETKDSPKEEPALEATCEPVVEKVEQEHKSESVLESKPEPKSESVSESKPVLSAFAEIKPHTFTRVIPNGLPTPSAGARPLPTIGPKPEIKYESKLEIKSSEPEQKSNQVVPKTSSTQLFKLCSDPPIRTSPFTRPTAAPASTEYAPSAAPIKPLPAVSTPTTESQIDFSARSTPAKPVSTNVTGSSIRSAKPVSSHATGNSGPGTPRSLTKPAMEAAAALSEFFGDKKPDREYNIDTSEILMKRPKGSQVAKTLAVRLVQISGDGRQVPVPLHNERILFDQEMYICIHSFTSVSGQNIAQVYFWAGDEVPQSAIDDAQVFANREAKNAGADLIRMVQGRETAEFINALGGVIIVRRGSSNKFDSLASSLLCGRRHLGQVVFDEIDFSSSNLCSGFPYLVAKGGRCVLWKGKGSDVQELSYARLIGMDLTLMGELEEVDDGHESESFWVMFNGNTKPHSADHWRLKPNYDMYSSRLFQSDASIKEQILEISPFNQKNLKPTGIYVVDAFFEMYIIVGSKAQTQYASFRNALDFAQEYAILASGMEDRPFVPITTVVLEGIPRDLKSVFRKWNDFESPTVTAAVVETSSGLKRGRSLRIVPLTHALQAFSE